VRSDTTPARPRDLAVAWAQTRQRIVVLVAGVTAAEEADPVPTLPGTSLRSVVAHLVHQSSYAADGGDPQRCNRDVVESDSRHYESVGWKDLLAAWDAAQPQLSRRIGSGDAGAGQLITDLVMHEHDIRTTLGQPGSRDSQAILIALDELAGQFSDRVQERELPPLRVIVEQWGTIVGDGPARACLVADRFEFVRGMAGRRSATEVRRWNWGVDAAPYLAVLSASPLPDDEIHERDPRVPEHMRDREFVF
jgi:hypothetical protein